MAMGNIQYLAKSVCWGGGGGGGGGIGGYSKSDNNNSLIHENECNTMFV